MDFLGTAEFWVAVSFFLFLCLVAYFGVHKKIAVALDERAAAIAKELADAKALREEAEAVLADYRKKTGNAAEEAQNIIELAAKEAEVLALETSRTMTEKFERYGCRRGKDRSGRGRCARDAPPPLTRPSPLPAKDLRIADRRDSRQADRRFRNRRPKVEAQLGQPFPKRLPGLAPGHRSFLPHAHFARRWRKPAFVR